MRVPWASRLSIVVSAEMDAKGEPSGVLVLGEVKNAASFRTYLDGQLENFAKELNNEPNKVLNVLQKGYLLHDRVLRPAMVMVSKAKES